MTSSKSQRSGLFVCCFALLAAACADAKPRAGDSESHFLVGCDGDRACPDDLACLCGVCTLACEDDDTCVERFAGATCGSLSNTECGAQAPGAACRVTCDGDDDCRDLGPDHRCADGACLAPSALGEPDAGPMACVWPSYLDDPSRPAGACTPARHALTCDLAGSSGAKQLCLTNDTTCESTTDLPQSNCRDRCEPDEYAITCGLLGPEQGQPDPPVGCRDLPAGPGGNFQMCCPCGGSDERDPAYAVAECTWPKYLDDTTRPAGTCTPAQHLLACKLGGGAMQGCLSDGDTCDPPGDQDPADCESQCAPGEYALACGGIGPNAGEPDPPDGCTSTFPTPGGIVYMCCPCGG